MNHSKSSLPTSDKSKTHAPTTDPVYSGPTGMDQSVKLGSVPASRPSNAGNRVPDLKDIFRGKSSR